MTTPPGRERVSTPDVLGAPYSVETIELDPDDEGDVVAHLVHRPAVGPRWLRAFADPALPPV